MLRLCLAIWQLLPAAVVAVPCSRCMHISQRLLQCSKPQTAGLCRCNGLFPCLQVLRSMKLYGAEKDFEAALEWLNQWACSRSFGLGTRCTHHILIHSWKATLRMRRLNAFRCRLTASTDPARCHP